ncbi:MAG: hypothetical protein AMXMBFR33_04140 [Candidatus Xenobia bacterium]
MARSGCFDSGIAGREGLTEEGAPVRLEPGCGAEHILNELDESHGAQAGIAVATISELTRIA